MGFESKWSQQITSEINYNKAFDQAAFCIDIIIPETSTLEGSGMIMLRGTRSQHHFIEDLGINKSTPSQHGFSSTDQCS
jgi:hypothetical protein